MQGKSTSSSTVLTSFTSSLIGKSRTRRRMFLSLPPILTPLQSRQFKSRIHGEMHSTVKILVEGHKLNTQLIKDIQFSMAGQYNDLIGKKTALDGNSNDLSKCLRTLDDRVSSLEETLLHQFGPWSCIIDSNRELQCFDCL